MKQVTFCEKRKNTFSAIHFLQRVLFFCLVALIGLSSCEKDPTPEPQPEPEKTEEKKSLVVLDWPKALEDCITDAEKKGLKDGTTSWWKVWDDMKKRCPDVENVDNGAELVRLARWGDNAALVSSKHDLKAELCKFADDDKCCIDTLTIMGHGSSGLITVGGGQQAPECKYINGNTEDWMSVLEDKMKAALCDSAVIFLNGCNVGSGEKGLKKMQFIADAFDVTVIAPTRTGTAGEDLEDYESDSLRVVKPGDTSTDNVSEEETDQKAAGKIKGKMKPSSEKPLKNKIVGLGVYPINYDAIPSLSQGFTLPINDPAFLEIVSFEAINGELSVIEEEGLTRVASTIWIVAYEDGSFEVAKTIFSNHLFTKSTPEGNIYFQVNDFGRQLIQQAIEMSVN